jgi:predicted dehydrogenase
MHQSPRSPWDRRDFLQWSTSAGVAAGLAAVSTDSAQGFQADTVKAGESKRVSPNDKILLGIMGVNGRGSALAQTFMDNGGAVVGAVCDVDSRALDKGVAIVEKGSGKKPAAYGDFRRILDDRSIDALVVAAPNHWHAPATILGCAAGKHVYVEKPCSHNPLEGELAVQAARKHNRVVQMGSQRRSRPSIIEAVGKLHAGEIGRVMFARTWYNNRRASIGHGKPAAIPEWLDFTLWQGPAPDRPYVDNLIHYNWHWHWHWGNGELGNNGIHILDVARWALGVDFPSRVTSAGGKYRHDDDQETPDTHLVSFGFGDKTITWEGLSWSPFGPNISQFGATFHGDKGSLLLQDNGYKIFDMQNKEIASFPGKATDGEHIANFLDCIRSGNRPNADIEEGHKSTLLCHLGNIAHRVNRVLTCDPKNGHILEDAEAAKLWGREYRKGWELS